jgi:hypothetical protein
MRQSWLVLATVLTLATLLVCAGEARAKRAAPCACPAVITVPERGATNVPLNAKLWSFGLAGPHTYTASDGAVIPNVQVEVPALRPNDSYKNADWMMDFTTTGEHDEIAPDAPGRMWASIVTLADGHVEAIALSAQLPIDAALVRIDVRDAAGGVARLITTPSRMHLCQPGLQITPGNVTVEVRALDLAGNESAPASMNIVTVATLSHDPELSCRFGAYGGAEHEHHRRHGHGFEILLFIFVIPAMLISWIVIVIIRRLTAKRQPAQPISLLAAEEVVRRLLRWQAIWTAIVVTATLAATYGVDDDMWILFVPWLFSTFCKLLLQRRAQRLLDRPETDALRRGPWLVVTSLRDSVMVRASDSDFVAGNRRAIPTSVVQ